MHVEIHCYDLHIQSHAGRHVPAEAPSSKSTLLGDELERKRRWNNIPPPYFTNRPIILVNRDQISMQQRCDGPEQFDGQVAIPGDEWDERSEQKEMYWIVQKNNIATESELCLPVRTPPQHPTVEPQTLRRLNTNIQTGSSDFDFLPENKFITRSPIRQVEAEKLEYMCLLFLCCFVFFNDESSNWTHFRVFGFNTNISLGLRLYITVSSSWQQRVGVNITSVNI